MRGRNLILFVVALLLAGGTAVLVRSWLAQRPVVVAAPPPPAPQKSVLVARAAITRGQILKPADLAWQPWPQGGIGAAFIVADAKSAKSPTGWVAREPFAAGEPIVKTKIVAPGDRGFLAAVLSPGMRAVSVPVDISSDISGFVFPGDRVDVLITLALPQDGANAGGYQHKAAETVLHDVLVLAIDQRLDSKDGQAVPARTVTFEVTPKQSEIVALAENMGKLSLSLRSLTAASEPGPSVLALASSTPESGPGGAADSIDGHGSDGFTLDTEFNPLLGNPFGIKHNSREDKVCILRGNGTSSNGCESQPASRGS